MSKRQERAIPVHALYAALSFLVLSLHIIVVIILIKYLASCCSCGQSYKREV